MSNFVVEIQFREVAHLDFVRSQEQAEALGRVKVAFVHYSGINLLIIRLRTVVLAKRLVQFHSDVVPATHFRHTA